MKSNATNRLIAAILVIAALGVAFFALALNPKREEASELSAEADQIRVALSESRAQVAAGVAARRDFPVDYQQLVVLGAAVPGSDETPSLLVQLNRIAEGAGVHFNSMQLASSGSGEEVTEAPATPAPEATPPSSSESGAVPASATVPPTEAAAAVMPLGASIGPAGLAVMPYNLTFSGGFFQIADFLKGLDSLVHTGSTDVAVDGRLLTVNSFALNADGELGFPHLDATFSVTTYLTPPGQGTTAGATATTPAAAEGESSVEAATAAAR